MKIRIPRLTRRRFAFLVGAWVTAVTASLSLTAWQVRQGNIRELRSAYPVWSEPCEGRTIVVFAPHCDDEILGAGGLIRRAWLRGAEVWVVLLTNGDGFRYAVSMDNRSLRVRPDSFVDFGYRRQEETYAAMERLGLPRDQVITLGYPDRGLAPMWTTNWTLPYVSPYTRETASPYINSYTPGALYTGQQLHDDLIKLLAELEPTDIILPHPNDQHSDHWATSLFVTGALHELGWLEDRHVIHYLVHRGNWPAPQGLRERSNLAPPSAMVGLDTQWSQYFLDLDTIEAKKHAITEFHSQTGGTRRFLRSFIRQNELFGLRKATADLPEIRRIGVDGEPDEWRWVKPIITDPVADGLVTHSRSAADILGVYAAKDEDRLYFRIAVRGVVNRSTTYELFIHPLGEPEGTTRLLLRRGTPAPDGWQVAYGRNDIELSCPLEMWEGKPIMVAATTSIRWYTVERSAHRIIVP